MTAPEWSVDQLGALADEWIAEREMFLSRMQAYLATQLPKVIPAQQRSLPLEAYQAELATMGAHVHRFLQVMDNTVWYTLQRRLVDFQRQLDDAFGAAGRAHSQRLASLVPPAPVAAVHGAVRHALGLMQHILHIYHDMQGQFDFSTWRITSRLVSQMKYFLYPVRLELPAFQRYWLLDSAEVQACEPPATAVAPESGMQHHDIDGYRGAYTTYVPEYYQAERAWPLIIAMHGASGSGEDFLWTWLKYAKSRGYLLLSAKSFGPTWHAWDAPSLLLMLDAMQTRYNIDPSRILLTGLSDGGSFGYDVGFAFPERFAGLAVVAGILRPHQRSPQAGRLPVYIAHGERDHLFPVQFIRMVAAKLREWGHQVTYHELSGFGHAYPAGENTAILDWFDTASTPP